MSAPTARQAEALRALNAPEARLVWKPALSGGYVHSPSGMTYVNGNTLSAIQRRGWLDEGATEYGPEKTVKSGFTGGEKAIRPVASITYRISPAGIAAARGSVTPTGQASRKSDPKAEA